MRHLSVCLAFSAVLMPFNLSSQASIPIHSVSVTVRSLEAFDSPPSVRSLPHGLLLVHDPLHRRLIVFDSTLSKFTVSADSSGAHGLYYPFTMYSFSRLIPYLGDSTLFTDFASRAFAVIDPNGRFSRSMAHLRAADLNSVIFESGGLESVDSQGRLIYRGSNTIHGPADSASSARRVPSTRDTAPIVRADFNRRKIDTIGSFSVKRPPEIVPLPSINGKPAGIITINPIVPASDDWGVMTDGSVAIIRAHDYHVDFIREDGSTFSGPKLPFDWRRLTDSEKHARIDSIQRVIDSVDATGRPYGSTIRAKRTPGQRPLIDTIVPKVQFTPIDEITEYLPPIGANALRPDLQNNVWLLPTTSSQAKGGLLYDVVNRKGELVERVQLPGDRLIIGFGQGDIIICAHYDSAKKLWTLEKARVMR